MSTKNIPDDGLLQPVSTTNPPSPKISSSAAEIKANQTEGADPTSLTPDFDYEAAAQRAPGEW